MKRGQMILTAFIGSVPLACGMLAAVCTFTTAFEIGFLPGPLILFCALGALLLSFWMTIPKYGFGFGALYLAGVIFLVVYRSASIKAGAVAFARGVLRMLPEGLTGSFDLQWFEEQYAAVPNPELCVSILLMIVAAGLGILLAYALLHSKVAALPLLILMPPVLLAFVYIDEPPAWWTIILLIVFCGYTLLGNGFKRGESPQRGIFLTAIGPILLLYCALIALAFPKRTYTAIPEETRQKIFSDLFGDVSDRIVKQIGNSSPDEIELHSIRDRENDPTVMFSVRASKAGNYHLHVRSYGLYNGHGWMEAKPYNGAWRSMEALGSRQRGADATMDIRSELTDERIVPYAFRANGVATEEDRIMAKAMRNYSWSFTNDYSIAPHEITEEERAYYEFALKQYTMHDDRFLGIAKEAGITPPESTDAYTVYETAWNVAAYVRSNGVYTHTPAPAPEGSDFILYFLTESKEGYCVHFASATTAILQSLGIPARYASGYYVSGVSGLWLSVDGSARHAWTEIYLYGVGWIPIESTPPFPENPPVEHLLPQKNEPEDPIKEPTDLPVTVPPIIPTPTPGAIIEPDLPTSIPETPVPVPKTDAPNQPPAVPGVTDEPIDPQSPQENQSARRSAWWLLLIIPLLPAIWAGVCILVRMRREAKFRDPDVRKAIPEMAYYLKRLQRYGAKEDPDAERWAAEAAFSDHSMKEEQKVLRRRVHAAQKEITQGKPLRRFLFRWVLFIT